MMKIKVMTQVFVTFALLMHVSCSAKKTMVFSQADSSNSKNEPKALPTVITELDSEYIQRLILLLSEEDKDERIRAQMEILRLAEKSASHRETIINRLILTVEGLNLEGKLVLDAPNFGLWLSVTQLFSKLRATESIDLLIRFIYCGDGLSGGASYHLPAEGALVSMGSLAVPKLSNALLHNNNAVIKKSVAKCLGNIGGVEAKQALESALRVESDQDIIHTIKLALSAITRGHSKV